MSDLIHAPHRWLIWRHLPILGVLSLQESRQYHRSLSSRGTMAMVYELHQSIHGSILSQNIAALFPGSDYLLMGPGQMVLSQWSSREAAEMLISHYHEMSLRVVRTPWKITFPTTTGGRP